MRHRKPLTKVQFQFAGNNKNFSPCQEIRGYVLFTPQQRVSLSQSSLSFEGKTKVLVDCNRNNLPLASARTAHTFLRMVQPLEEELPQISEFEVGTEYKLPFKFVIPTEIPHHICRHDRHNEQVYHEHIQLPPSMGGSTGSSGRGDSLDHMSADTVSTSYAIHLKIAKNTTIKPTEPMGEWSHQVRIRSPRPEHSPIFISTDSRFYNMWQGAYLKQGLCQRRLGHLSAWTEQPAAIPAGGSSTSIAVRLQYMALAGTLLPSILHVQLKLNAFTMYSPTPWCDFPDMTDPSSWDPKKEYYRQKTALDPPHIERSMLEWHSCSIDKVDGFTKDCGAPATYSVVLDLPIRLAIDRALTPTFHSCLVSRIYSLEISICYTFKGCLRRPKLTLTVPIQVS